MNNMRIILGLLAGTAISATSYAQYPCGFASGAASDIRVSFQSECLNCIGGSAHAAASTHSFGTVLEGGTECELHVADQSNTGCSAQASAAVPDDLDSLNDCPLEHYATYFIVKGNLAKAEASISPTGFAAKTSVVHALLDEFTGDGICQPNYMGQPFELVPITSSAAASANGIYEVVCNTEASVDFPLLDYADIIELGQEERVGSVAQFKAETSTGPIAVSLCMSASLLGFDVNDPTNGTGTASVPIPAGTLTMSAMSFVFTDKELDYDGDDRFGQADILGLDLVIPTTDPDLLERFDIDGDGVVSQDDLDFLQEIITCGLGAGIFGDYTGNGLTDCDDLAGVLGHTYGPAVVLGTSGYRIELDEDLDGDNDSEDRCAALQTIQPADLTCDGVLNFDDLDAWIAAYLANDPLADIDGNGILNLDDEEAFIDSYTNGCP